VPQQEIPYWVTSTHPDHEYWLTVMESASHGVEEIKLTRDEYITLKAHLAAMRGYRVPTAAEAIALVNLTESLDLYHNADHQQVARHIEIARQIYQGHPELIMTVSNEFDAELAELAK
jgi:hypothetical protein